MFLDPEISDDRRQLLLEKENVYLDAHEGLRGAAAIWIMLFHCILRSTYSIDFQGSSIMPLFFTLTGLTLAVVYGKCNPSRDEIEKGIIQPSAKTTSWSFYINRLVRVAPVYFLLSFTLSFPLLPLGFGEQSPSQSYTGMLSTTITFTSTMFLFIIGAPLDGPSWTVQTFVWIWLCFPYFMRRTRQMTIIALANWIVYFYWIQLFLVIILFFGTITTITFWPAFCLATMHPIVRIPLFLMGIYGGELLNRYSAMKEQDTTLLGVWPRGHFFPCCCTPGEEKSTNREIDEARWTSFAFWQALGLLLLTVAVGIINQAVGEILGAVWLQAIVPFAQLELIVALTQQSRSSLVNLLLTTRLAKYLGKISMTIYLVHYPLIYFVCWGNYGFRSLSWPTGASRTPAGQESQTSVELEAWREARQLPLWGIPLVAVMALGLASLIFFTFEEPVRRLLKS